MRLAGQFNDTDGIPRLLGLDFQLARAVNGVCHVLIQLHPLSGDGWVFARVLVRPVVKSLVPAVEIIVCGQSTLQLIGLDPERGIQGLDTLFDVLLLRTGRALLKLIGVSFVGAALELQ